MDNKDAVAPRGKQFFFPAQNAPAQNLNAPAQNLAEIKSIFYSAIAGNTVDVIRRLDRPGISPNVQYPGFGTLLHVACLYGHIDLVRALVRCGANISERNENAQTPLDFARAENHGDIVNFLTTYASTLCARA